MDFNIRKPQFFDDLAHQRDQLHLDQRAFRANVFHTKLMMLAEPAALRFFIPECRRDIKQFRQSALCKHAVFQIGTDSACRSFRLQRDAASALIFKCVHFLLYHIGRFSHAALEKNGMFKDRRHDLLDVVRRSDLFAHFFDLFSFCHGISVPVCGTSRSLCDHKFFLVLSYFSV